MAQLNPKEMQQALAKPFAPEDLEWRLQNTIEEQMRGLAVPYVTNRAIQNRLDEVCGPENWYNDFKPWHSNGKKEAQLCGIAIFFEGRGFITKWDGAEDSDIEAVKGGLIWCWTMRWMCRAAAEKRRSFLSSTSAAQTASRLRPSALISCGEWRPPS